MAGAIETKQQERFATLFSNFENFFDCFSEGDLNGAFNLGLKFHNLIKNRYKMSLPHIERLFPDEIRKIAEMLPLPIEPDSQPSSIVGNLHFYYQPSVSLHKESTSTCFGCFEKITFTVAINDLKSRRENQVSLTLLRSFKNGRPEFFIMVRKKCE